MSILQMMKLRPRELGILLAQGLTASKYYFLGPNPASLVPGGREGVSPPGQDRKEKPHFLNPLQLDPPTVSPVWKRLRGIQAAGSPGSGLRRALEYQPLSSGFFL